MIAIASVQHTGTTFTRRLFLPNRIKVAHFSQGHLDTIAQHKIHITPLRKLEAIIGSWKRRFMDMKRLYLAIDEMTRHRTDFYLPVDAEDREDYLNAISEATGRKLVTDWEPVGHRGHLHESGEEHNPEYSELILRDYSEWFGQFYGR